VRGLGLHWRKGGGTLEGETCTGERERAFVKEEEKEGEEEEKEEKRQEDNRILTTPSYSFLSLATSVNKKLPKIHPRNSQNAFR